MLQINFLMDRNLFVYVEWFPVVHVPSLHGFLPEKIVTKKGLKKRKKGREQERVTYGWTVVLRLGPASF